MSFIHQVLKFAVAGFACRSLSYVSEKLMVTLVCFFLVLMKLLYCAYKCKLITFDHLASSEKFL